MDKIRLLVADADQFFTDSLQTALSKYPEIELIGVYGNACDALLCVRKENPDVILFDLILPGMDGISFLQSIRAWKTDLICVCCTAFYSPVSIEAARRYGASYYLYKPVELQSVCSAVLNCYELGNAVQSRQNALPESDAELPVYNLKIRNYLVSLGIPAKLSGCGYIAEAIRLSKSDPSLASNLSKGLYLEIAKNLDSTPERIERCIRNAISAAYQKGILRQLLIACPTNKEFINYVLNNMEL